MIEVADDGRHKLVAGRRTMAFVLGGAGMVGGQVVAERDGLYLDPQKRSK